MTCKVASWTTLRNGERVFRGRVELRVMSEGASCPADLPRNQTTLARMSPRSWLVQYVPGEEARRNSGQCVQGELGDGPLFRVVYRDGVTYYPASEAESAYSSERVVVTWVPDMFTKGEML
jgi:hypothetical protein